MRGIIFREYLEFAETLSSIEQIDHILVELKDQLSEGYTTVGNYSFDEFAVLHTAVCEILKTDPADFAYRYGLHLFQRFKVLFPQYFKDVNSGLDFLDKVGTHIHLEVKKLYPDANPPEVYLERVDQDNALLHYQSHRPLSPVAKGLAEACLKTFPDAFTITSEITHNGKTTFGIERTS